MQFMGRASNQVGLFNLPFYSKTCMESLSVSLSKNVALSERKPSGLCQCVNDPRGHFIPRCA